MRFKIPKLSHPWAKNAAGFTLVELIVVIAILGVLAGVGTVGYSGYVKSANKKADKVLVGNIIRAVEIGNNSGAFVSDEVVQASENGVQFPVGMITLTKTPGSDASSFNIGQVGKTTGTCDVPGTTYNIITGEPIKMYKDFLDGLHAESGRGRTEVSVYPASAYQTIQYCVTHSDPTAVTALTSAAAVKKNVVGKSFGADVLTEKSGILDPTGSILSGLATGHTHGTEMTSNTMVSGSNVQGGVLDSCLKAAYGDDYANDMVLKSDAWTDPTLNIAFDATKTMLGSARTLSDVLSLASGSSDVRNEFDISAKYDNGAAVIATFADCVASKPEAFIADWKRVDNSELPYGSTFGDFAYAATGAKAREIYSAARMAYNSSFSEYVKQNHGDANGATHASYITSFATQSTFIPFVGTLSLPATICLDAFNNSTELHSDVKNCETCKTLYNKYVDSGASLEAAYGLIDMMTSMDEMESESPKVADQNAFYSYYTNYLNEFQSIFNSAKNDIQGKSAIVIIFYAEDGKITYDISPKSADPRAD